MRPRPDAAEKRAITSGVITEAIAASMRPRPDAAEKLPGGDWLVVQRWLLQ